MKSYGKKSITLEFLVRDWTFHCFECKLRYGYLKLRITFAIKGKTKHILQEKPSTGQNG